MSNINLIIDRLSTVNESVSVTGNIKSILGNSYLKNEDKFIDWVEDYFTDGYDNRKIDSCELKSIKVVDIEPVIRKGYGVNDPKHPEYKELGGIPSHKITMVVDGEVVYNKDDTGTPIDNKKIVMYLGMRDWDTETHVKESFIMDRNQKEVDKITLKPREWCYFYSSNGIMYVVHNVRGKMKAFKDQTNEVKPTKEMKDKITLLSESVEISEGSKKIDIKKLEKELEQELILGMYRFGGFNNREAKEYSNIKIEKKSDGRLFIHVSAELDYDGCAELSELLDKVVSKYDRYAYFDMECPGRLVSVIEESVTEGFYKKGKRYKTDDYMYFVVKKVNNDGTLIIYDEDVNKEYRAEISDIELLNPVMVKESSEDEKELEKNLLSKFKDLSKSDKEYIKNAD